MTTSLVNEAKIIRMAGITGPMSGIVSLLRRVEIDISKKLRWIMVAYNASGGLDDGSHLTPVYRASDLLLQRMLWEYFLPLSSLYSTPSLPIVIKRPNSIRIRLLLRYLSLPW